MTPEAESRAADQAYKDAVELLKGATDEIDFLPAVDARYNEKFVVPDSVWSQIDEDVDKVDFFLCMN